mgnify:CR=1 FL=1|tara:strand:- start:50465 stop:50692 length:228 start_codon:yes stop_codon:yes gene_type:complete
MKTKKYEDMINTAISFKQEETLFKKSMFLFLAPAVASCLVLVMVASNEQDVEYNLESEIIAFNDANDYILFEDIY